MLKRRLLLGMVLCISWSLTGCRQDEIKDFRRELDGQAGRLAALEAWQKEINNNIGTLQGLVDALRNSRYITSVGETTTGYTITLSDGSVLQIYHGLAGQDGKDGGIVMPSVSIRDSTDGHTYWVVNGELLRDSEGKGVRADGEKGNTGPGGSQGVAGVTPQVRINPENNEWEISVDRGVSWATTGVKATGVKGEQGETGGDGIAGPVGPAGIPGESVFAERGVDVQEDYVEFTLADAAGTRIRVPRCRSRMLKFPQGTTVCMPWGVEKRIPFTVHGSGGAPEVNVFGNGGWKARVEMDIVRADSGVVVVTAPGQAGHGSVLVLLNDGVGGGWTYRLDLTARPTGKMIYVAGGGLDIIGPHGDGWRLTNYWLGQTEVTVGLYCDFLNEQKPVLTEEILNAMGDTMWFHNGFITTKLIKLMIFENGKWRPGIWSIYYAGGYRLESMSEYPIFGVTWYGIRAYCRWAGGGLPTEAQWEYAARGGKDNPNAKTEKYAGSNIANEVGWTLESGMADGCVDWGYHHGPWRVAGKIPNYLGFYDMTGNLEEWCSDFYGMDSYPSNGCSDQENPQGAMSGEKRVIRGGAFGGRPETLNFRFELYPSVSGIILGFRLAFNP